MNILGVIPARYNSTRFPGKPLVDILGKSMIQRVYEQAVNSKVFYKVIVATDDSRIYNHVQEFGGFVAMTSPNHTNGTKRCAEIVAKFENNCEVVINIQGDEPFIDPVQIQLLQSCFEDSETQIATLIKKISSEDELFDLNIPKVVLTNNLKAMYFSRLPIPFNRNFSKEHWLKQHIYYKHIGIYGYKKNILLDIAKLYSSDLEITESLEQLCWIENGYTIKAAITETECISIDTPNDLQQALKRYSLQ